MISIPGTDKEGEMYISPLKKPKDFQNVRLVFLVQGTSMFGEIYPPGARDTRSIDEEERISEVYQKVA